jgi:glucose/arabinose dehydrogenase
MEPEMKKRVFMPLLALACAAGACQFLLPERFVVNGPTLSALFGMGGVEAPGVGTIGDRISLREGFSASLYAEDLAGARTLLFAPNGDLLVSRPRSGEVVVLAADADGDRRADSRRSLMTERHQPYGMAFHGRWLYLAEGDAISRIEFDRETSTTRGEFERLVTDLPSGGNHWTRTLHFGPDGWMYLSLGSSCNVCIEEDPRRAAMVRYRPDGSGEEIYATGLRNAVDFDWQPGTGTLYATDNGRDLLGDDFPPCELNAIEAGGFYGWPFASGDNVPDPDFGEGNEALIATAISPAHAFRAHNAPLGITFVRGENAPAELRGAALVALHGSWNRTSKDGYSVVSLHWDDAGRISERDFMTGFERDEDVIGRPAHIAEGPDGAFYVSDDYSGSIWRVAAGEAAAPQMQQRMRPAAAQNPQPELAAGAAERGALLYETLACASCHEVEHAADGVVVEELVDLDERFTLAQMSQLLAAPPPPMPNFELPEKQRLDLAAYLLERFR